MGSFWSLGTSGDPRHVEHSRSGPYKSDGQTFFTGATVGLSSFLPADYLSQIAAAFDAWHQVANINFVDGGGNFGIGGTANIRIGGGFIDGFNPNGSVVGRGFFLLAGGSPNATPSNGDIVLDSGDQWTDALLYEAILHEIGHALGLDHVPQNNPPQL